MVFPYVYRIRLAVSHIICKYLNAYQMSACVYAHICKMQIIQVKWEFGNSAMARLASPLNALMLLWVMNMLERVCPAMDI